MKTFAVLSVLTALGILASLLYVAVQIREGVGDLIWHPIGGQVPYPAPGDEDK